MVVTKFFGTFYEAGKMSTSFHGRRPSSETALLLEGEPEPLVVNVKSTHSKGGLSVPFLFVSSSFRFSCCLSIFLTPIVIISYVLLSPVLPRLTDSFQ